MSDRAIPVEVYQRLTNIAPQAASGRVVQAVGAELRITGLSLRIGESVTVHTADGPVPAEVVGVHADRTATALPLADLSGAARGDRVARDPHAGQVGVGDALLGRVVDGLGRPLDGQPAPTARRGRLHQPAPNPMERQPITAPLPTGVRVVDLFATVGRGQRIGLFAGSGVGKSTLLGMMTRGSQADVQVLAMVGERGREVRDFLDSALDERSRSRTVAVVSTSDQPALLRVRALTYATRLAEHYADAGNDVLLLCDSLTRVATAQREVGLAAGEPPSSRGYTPSVFALLPRLLERAGPRAAGTITGFYTVLVDGDDHDEPIADAVRGILDGHLVLSRDLAVAGRFPAVDPLASLSRLADRVRSAEQHADLAAVRAAYAAAAEVRDLVELGAYQAGANPQADLGLAISDDLHALLAQPADEPSGYDDAWQQLSALAARVRGPQGAR